MPFNKARAGLLNLLFMRHSHKTTHYTKNVASYTVQFIPAPEGGYSVDVPTLPGCITEGRTFEEAERNAREAIELYLESLLAHGESIPQEGETISKRITVSVHPVKV